MSFSPHMPARCDFSFPNGVVLAALSVFMTVAASTAVAQTSPAWNRRVTGLSVAIDPTGGFEVLAEWRVDLEGTSSVAVEVGTSADTSVNGVLSGSTDSPDCVIWEVESGTGDCGSSPEGTVCGTANVSGNDVDLVCDAGACSTPPLTSVLPGVALTPGDEITVLLRPAPGALPDSSTGGDDTGLLTHGSWNRKLVSVEVVPTPGGVPGEWDVLAQMLIEISGASTVPIQLGIDTEPVADECCQEACCCPSCSTECSGGGCGGGGGGTKDDIEVILMPAPGVASGPGTTFVCDAGPSCTQMCAQGQIGLDSFTGTCDATDCVCRTETLTLVWSGYFFQPEDEITIILRPAPGALPELPGFNDDDDMLIVPVPRVAPAASDWSGLALALALLSAGTLAIRGRLLRAVSI